jgi:hypothetical protein
MTAMTSTTMTSNGRRIDIAIVIALFEFVVETEFVVVTAVGLSDSMPVDMDFLKLLALLG